MPHLPSLPEDARVMDVLKAYPESSAPLIDYQRVVLRGPPQLSPGERELIAAYVSGLNARHYCRYVRELTGTPSRMTRADADAVHAAGWEEKALFDAISVCALFNLMNRLVEGAGLTGDDAYFAAAADRLSSDPSFSAYRTPPAGG